MIRSFVTRPSYRFVSIGVDLAGILTGTHGDAEGRSVPNGVGCGEGCPLSSRLESLGERRELPEGFGQSPDRKRILVYFEGYRMLLFVLI